MTFHPIIVGSSTWNQSGPVGRYVLSTAAFGDPFNGFQITGGKKNAKTGLTTATINRILELDVTSGGVTTRNRSLVSIGLQVAPGFTSDAIDIMLQQTSDFATVAILNRLLNGEA